MNALRVFLATMMVVSMIGMMAGCGGNEPASSNDTDTTAPPTTTTTAATNAADGVSLPPALAGITKINVPTLDYVGWELSGGMVDGVEMEVEDVQTVLTNFGGRMDFVFTEGGKVMLSNGQEALESTYKIIDGTALYMQFNEYKYHAVFTSIEGNTVMIVANETEPNSALYFLPISEG